MFTGIIEEVGTVRAVRPGGLTVGARKVLEGTRLGDSINIDGACLTVTAIGGDSFSVDVVPETLRRTNLGSLRPGDGVNLERGLAVGERMGGHFVQGHVDETGKVLSIRPEAQGVSMRVGASPELLRYTVEKGFIAVDGVSLTIVSCDNTAFSVALVPFTLAHTNLGSRKVGDLVNLEVDILAKYVERLKGSPGITRGFLEEHGFLGVPGR